MYIHRPSLKPWAGAPGPFDVIAVAASFGGLKALSQLLAALPADFPAPIIVVQHLSSRFGSRLAEILDGRTPLRVGWAEHGACLCPGTVSVAPPGRHVLLIPTFTLALSDGPRVAFSRPAADVLFRSIAAVSKDRAIGVVLTGYGHDGAAGAQAIKGAGGRIIVQDLATSEANAMPAATINTRSVDFVLPLERIAPALVSLCTVPGAAGLFYVPREYTGHLPYQP